VRAFAGKLPLLIPPTQQSRWPASEVADLVGVGGTKHNWAFGAASPDRPDLPARVSEEMFPARGRVRRFSHLDAAAAAHRSRPVCAGSWRSNIGVCCFGMWPLASGAEGLAGTL